MPTPAISPPGSEDHRALNDSTATVLIRRRRDDASADSGPPAGEPRFRVLHQHARGGLGQVFLALDTRFNREVAVKELNDAFALDADARTRFIREAEITGVLEHPGIVPVYDLGQKPDGRLFYAMQLIRGENLAQAVARFHGPTGPRNGSRRLAFRELLARFINVCQTVAYAHARGVLHRDLKPSNVMLGAFGETLVVDWGLAKRFDPDHPPTLVDDLPDAPTPMEVPDSSKTGSTRMGETMGTPAYMSPEQANGRVDAMGPSSDVYSLGATLFHMLTGNPPTSGVSIGREVPWALAAVCRKAMSRHPRDRYQCVAALAEDLERFLADEPVTAGLEPVTVRIVRWMRRHRSAVAATMVSLLLAVFALTGTLLIVNQAWHHTEQARQETEVERSEAARRRDEALQQRHRTRAALDAMTSNLAGQTLATQEKVTPQQQSFLNEMLRYYQEFAQEAGGDADSQELAIRAHMRLGLIQRRLGQISEAIAAFRAALAAADYLVKIAPARASAVEAIGDASRNLAGCLREMGQWVEAEQAYSRAISAYEELHAGSGTIGAISEACAGLGSLLADQGRTDEALKLVDRAVSLRRTAVKEWPNDLELLRDLSAALREAAVVRLNNNRFEEADEMCQEVVVIRTKLAEAQPWRIETKYDLVAAHETQASLQSRRGKVAAAVASYRKALVLLDPLLVAHPATALYKFQQCLVLCNLARCLAELNQRGEAETAGRQAIELGRKLIKEFPDQAMHRMKFGNALSTMALLFEDLGRASDAERLYREAIELQQQLATELPQAVDNRVYLGGTWCNFAILLKERQRLQEATAAADHAVATLTAVLAADRRNVTARRFLRNSLWTRSDIHDRADSFDKALTDIELAIANDALNSGRIHLQRAWLLQRAGRSEEALSVADAALAGRYELSGSDRAFAARVLAVSARHADGDEADQLARRAVEQLELAVRSGFQQGRLLDGPEFHGLRDRDDFKAVRVQLGAPASVID